MARDARRRSASAPRRLPCKPGANDFHCVARSEGMRLISTAAFN
ncbi:hypothetical protein BMAPRL20_A0048 [Burkholderia mallei PRL-20]|nr:hypothetical protein GBP346_A0538 [Burkholderia pseudomallei MSHR346]EEP86955.1 hypothetical protein BMAGB8_0012 [Burkholderia mallei GB8 horse 4]EES27343.1 hypothetical protein BURPS1106B_A3910 [Burkholderia pseudomallei 1106b]EES45204.1 hypothetical protein BMAPRL20_A0048 [Burkholderia mallei PRL-20]